MIQLSSSDEGSMCTVHIDQTCYDRRIITELRQVEADKLISQSLLVLRGAEIIYESCHRTL